MVCGVNVLFSNLKWDANPDPFEYNVQGMVSICSNQNTVVRSVPPTPSYSVNVLLMTRYIVYSAI